MIKIKKSIFLYLVIVSLLSVSVLAASLPSVGGDNNAWGTVLNDFLQVAHDSTGQIKSGYISSSMITDATIGAIDIAMDVVNTTHIVNNTIQGHDVSTTAALNVTSLIVANGALNTTNASNIALANNTNFTGIYMNYTRFNLPAFLLASPCVTVTINMTGLPANAWCIPMGDSTLTNLSITGTNSSKDNCRVIVCNTGNATAPYDPPELTYGAIAIVPGSGLLFGY